MTKMLFSGIVLKYRTRKSIKNSFVYLPGSDIHSIDGKHYSFTDAIKVVEKYLGHDGAVSISKHFLPLWLTQFKEGIKT